MNIIYIIFHGDNGDDDDGDGDDDDDDSGAILNPTSQLHKRRLSETRLNGNCFHNFTIWDILLK